VAAAFAPVIFPGLPAPGDAVPDPLEQHDATAEKAEQLHDQAPMRKSTRQRPEQQQHPKAMAIIIQKKAPKPSGASSSLCQKPIATIPKLGTG
jgi:hypothetical protein